MRNDLDALLDAAQALIDALAAYESDRKFMAERAPRREKEK